MQTPPTAPATTSSLAPTKEPFLSAPDRTALAIGSVVFIVLSTILAYLSKGFLEADGVTHYLYARFALAQPAYLVDVWARPVRMLLHAVPAQFFGLAGVRAASCAAAVATAWITYAIARRLAWPRPALAGLFVLAQPLFFLHSFSELTEVPFALVAAFAYLALVRRWWWAFALACGVLPASRPEGAAFVLMAIVLLVLHRRFLWLPLTLLPVVLWNHIGWVLWGADAGPWQRWLIDRFPYSAKSLYDAGPIYRYLAVLPTIVSPLILPAVLLGAFGLRRLRDADRTNAALIGRLFVPEEWLIAIIPWGILLVHTWLHFTGRMSSSGEPRYLLAASPFWALLACRGWTMLEARFNWRRPVLWASLAALVPIAVNATYPVVPLRPQPDAVLCDHIVHWYRSGDLAKRYPHLFATHPLIYYYLDSQIEGPTRSLIEHPPAGAIFVYDSLYGSYNSDADRVFTPAMFDAAGWTIAPGSEGLSLPNQTWRIYLSPVAAHSSSATTQPAARPSP